MPEKNISDIIQDILDKNKGFMRLSQLFQLHGRDIMLHAGIRSKDTASIRRKKLEAATEGKFMFHSKGNIHYILTPCEPSELVLGLLSPTKALDTSTINSLPFKKDEFASIINSLVNEGKAAVKLDKTFKPQIFRANANVQPVHTTMTPSGEYTTEKFREAFRALDQGRIAVRICDLRRRLDWPRDVFDGMLRELRDREIISLRTGDASTMTEDEVRDSFVDENGFRRGSVTWNGR